MVKSMCLIRLTIHDMATMFVVYVVQPNLQANTERCLSQNNINFSITLVNFKSKLLLQPSPIYGAHI